ncbi:MAG: hypothetical protein P0Y62_16335 [Candidatus Chryseobacterium colombiense]|nr:hypothetical protein [Chryseobacterium sp.]WEK69389.1 MAG: hypothetical protein P0Y62_16335 [Chryseobacterium sp.]
MLVQSPSRIFKSDFSVWKEVNSCAVNEFFSGEDPLKLRKVTEIVLPESGSYEFAYREKNNLLIIILYGEILINDFEKAISPKETFSLQSIEQNAITIKNNLTNEKADVLILEFKSKNLENAFTIEGLDLNRRNILHQISNNLKIPNFIGLYEGRKEQKYALHTKGSSIFGMVINGAFEFQNRLLEARDAILLSEIETLEFEALSENALLIFLEI